MNKALAGALALASILAACGGDDDGGGEASDLSKALYADLNDGLTIMNIYGGVRDQYTPKEFAAQVFLAVDEACPEYQDDPGIRNLLDGHGYVAEDAPWPD
jgi:hypothetical protein